MTNPLECLACDWVMPMGTHPDAEDDQIDQHWAQTNHTEFIRRGKVDPMALIEVKK